LGNVSGGERSFACGCSGPDEESIANIIGFEHRSLNLSLFSRGGVDDGQRCRVCVDPGENAGRLTPKDQHHRKDKRGNVLDGTFDGLDLQASAARGALKQRDRQAVVFSRQAGEQGIAGDGAAMKCGEEKKRVRQRIRTIGGGVLRADRLCRRDDARDLSVQIDHPRENEPQPVIQNNTDHRTQC